MKKNFIAIMSMSLLAAFTLSITGCNASNVTLGAYKGIEVTATQVSVTDEILEEELLSAIQKSMDYKEITDRAVIDGDTTNIDYIGKIDGVEFNGGSATGYDLVIGSGTFIDGFEDQIIGMEIGKTKDIEVTFPENYSQASYAGKIAVFTVTLNSIKVKEVPDEITDEMIQQISTEYSTVEEYKKYLKAELEKDAEELNLQSKQKAVWDAVVEACEVKNISSESVSSYAADYKANYEKSALQYGVTLTEFLQTYMNGMTEEQLDSELQSMGEQYIKEQMIVVEIAKVENITVSDEEYQSYLEDQATAQSATTEAFEQKFGTYIKDQLLYEKVRDFLVENANITLTDAE